MRTRLGKDYPGLNEKSSNGIYKKRPHSFRKTCSTNYENALAKTYTNARDLAHAYIGHSSYLSTYFQKTEEQKIIDHKKRTEEIKKEYLKQLSHHFYKFPITFVNQNIVW